MNKHGYIRKRFDEVFDLQMGKTPDRKNLSFFGGDNVWLSIKDMGAKYLSSSNECITDEAIEASGIKKVKKGTVMMSFKLTVGKCGIAACDLYTNEAIMAFNIKQEYNIKPDFLYFYLQGYNWKGANKAVKGLTLNKATISKHFIEIPPIDEQKAIVAELDEINNSIAEMQLQIADLDALAQSSFYTMFGDPVTNEKGWEVKSLGDIAHYSSKRVPASEMTPNNYVGVDNLLKDKQGKIDATFFPTEGTVTEYLDGDVLLGNIRPYLKKIWYANTNGGASGDVLVIQVNENERNNIHSFFIYFMLSLDSFFEYDMLHSKGAKMPRGSKPEIMKYQIFIPPLALQLQFVARVEAIESAKAELNAQIAEMQTLLAFRMDYYFD